MLKPVYVHSALASKLIVLDFQGFYKSYFKFQTTKRKKYKKCVKSFLEKYD